MLSDSDELEGRFPSGDANLCTSTLYYDGLRSAAFLAKELGKGASLSKLYNSRADKLAKAIEAYFGADVQGFHTYRYYDGNDVLRSWICMPLIVGILDRAEGTIAALTSDKLMTKDGLLTQQGSETFWDRSTLYSLRGMYIAGDTETAGDFMNYYSTRRLLGDHVHILLRLGRKDRKDISPPRAASIAGLSPRECSEYARPGSAHSL